MYFPYIRGKQFELIGLRELAEPLLSFNKNKISPIIEPVKDSSTFKTTIIELAKNDINFTIIINPEKGTFNNPVKIIETIFESIRDYTNYQVGIIFNKGINHQIMLDFLKNHSNNIPFLSIIHNATFDGIIDILKEYKSILNIKFNIVNLSNTSRRYHRNFNEQTRVELDDYFKSQSRNKDYLEVGESFFSEEHLYFKEEGFIGFSDYLSIGEEYSETGFLPYAVAIHLSYASESSNKIFIKHFVSDSNLDQDDVARKFEEAVNKLIKWCDETNYNSIAIPIYRDYHGRGHFPGLGTLKKLSLMNHIDLVLKLF